MDSASQLLTPLTSPSMIEWIDSRIPCLCYKREYKHFQATYVSDSRRKRVFS